MSASECSNFHSASARRLVGFTRGDTEYVISAIPLGGYVKMAGENPDDPRSGRDDEFLSKSKWERFQILIMGPLMNLILAVVVTAGVLMNGADIPAYQNKPPVVGQVTAGFAGRESRHSARRSDCDRCRPRRRHLGAILSSVWARAPAARPISSCSATASA